MWIRTQNKQRIINSDQIIDIFIDRSGTKIMAETTSKDRDFFTLGEYENRDTCLHVLESISVVIGNNIPMVTMPLGGEVDSWQEDMTKLATAYIVNNFRVK